MQLIKSSLSNIKALRTNYLNSIPEFQKLFLELLVNESQVYQIQNDDKVLGYTIVYNKTTIVEFYLLDQYITDSYQYFDKIIYELSINEIYCKSFDALLLSSCLQKELSYSVIGVLYRNYPGSKLELNSALQMEKVNLTSVTFLMGQDTSINELFETESQLIGFVENEHVFNFYYYDDFIGCGTVIKTHPDWCYCDLGVWVRPEFRGKSFGAQILLNLRKFALDKKLIPSCGCAVDNIASQKTIEKSGFVSKYKMLCFNV